MCVPTYNKERNKVFPKVSRGPDPPVPTHCLFFLLHPPGPLPSCGCRYRTLRRRGRLSPYSHFFGKVVRPLELPPTSGYSPTRGGPSLLLSSGHNAPWDTGVVYSELVLPLILFRRSVDPSPVHLLLGSGCLLGSGSSLRTGRRSCEFWVILFLVLTSLNHSSESHSLFGLTSRTPGFPNPLREVTPRPPGRVSTTPRAFRSGTGGTGVW